MALGVLDMAPGADLETYPASFHNMESMSCCESRLMGESEDRLESVPAVALEVVLANGAASRQEHGVMAIDLQSFLPTEAPPSL